MKESLRPQNSLQAQWHRRTKSTLDQCTLTSPPLQPPPPPSTCGRTAVPARPPSSPKSHLPLSRSARVSDQPPDCAAPDPPSPATTAAVATATEPEIHLPSTKAAATEAATLLTGLFRHGSAPPNRDRPPAPSRNQRPFLNPKIRAIPVRSELEFPRNRVLSQHYDSVQKIAIENPNSDPPLLKFKLRFSPTQIFQK